MAFTGKFVYMAHHFILLRLNPFGLIVDREGWWIEHSDLCHSCRFACQQRMLKTFPGPGSLCAGDEVVWLWHLLANFIYIYIYIDVYHICIYMYVYDTCIYIYYVYIYYVLCIYIYTYTPIHQSLQKLLKNLPKFGNYSITKNVY